MTNCEWVQTWINGLDPRVAREVCREVCAEMEKIANEVRRNHRRKA